MFVRARRRRRSRHRAAAHEAGASGARLVSRPNRDLRIRETGRKRMPDEGPRERNPAGKKIRRGFFCAMRYNRGMDEQCRNSPLKVTHEAAIGYALFWGLFGPHVGFGTPISWGLVIGGGAVLLGIFAAIEVRTVRRQRTRDDQPAGPDPDASLR